MRILLVVNASASSVTARTRVLIQQGLGAAHDLRVAETSRRGHAMRLAQGAAADGVDVVAVLGGDGTLNEAANGLAGTSTALGVLPGGSTNVFARSIGMVNDPHAATIQLLDSLANDEPRPVSLGRVNGRYFLFHVGFGFDAMVVAEVEKRSLLKRYFGAAVFAGAAVMAWTRYDRHSPWFTVDVPDRPPMSGYFAVCMRTSPYTFVGTARLEPAPGTSLDTGMSLVVCEKLSLTDLLGLVSSSLVRGGSSGSPASSGSSGSAGSPGSASASGGAGGPSASGASGASGRAGRRRREPNELTAGTRRLPFDLARHSRLLRDVTRAEVAALRPVPYQVDGDYLGLADHLTFRDAPDAIRLVMPRGAPPRPAGVPPTPTGSGK